MSYYSSYKCGDPHTKEITAQQQVQPAFLPVLAQFCKGNPAYPSYQYISKRGYRFINTDVKREYGRLLQQRADLSSNIKSVQRPPFEKSSSTFICS